MSICPRCGGTGIETFDTTDDLGYLATGSRDCTRCSPEAIRNRLVSPHWRRWAFVGAVGLALLACQDTQSPPPPVVEQGPVIASFTADPLEVEQGGTTTLTAIFSGGSGVIQPGGIPVTSGVPVVVTVTETTTYTLTVTTPGGVQLVAMVAK